MSEKTPMNEYNKAYLLVGRFMYHFALLESAVNDAIGKLLGLKALETRIATANMQFRSKIHILKSVVDLKSGRTDWNKDLQDIADFAATRNTIAHTVFGPNENGDGVRFLAIKASGKLKFPDTVYTTDDFIELFETAKTLRTKMEAITKSLGPSKNFLSELLAAQPSPEMQPKSDSLLDPLLAKNQNSPKPSRIKQHETGQD